jgi:flagellar biosynthesis anti-sigma factor FlgM
MQISATEVTKVLTSEKTQSKRGKSQVEFKQIEIEALPKTKVVEPDKAEVARVMEIVKDAPDVREDLVMELKARIEKGEYKVSGEEIAEMIMRRMKADKVR